MPDKRFLHQIYSSLPERIKNFTSKLFKKSDIFLLMEQFYSSESELRKKGWFKSAKRNRPVDGDGNPIPWYPYSAIDFLEERLNKTIRVFEYGGGYSTIWYAERVNEVVCVEHSKEWVDEISQRVPSNGQIINEKGQEYIEKPCSYSGFDLVIIDGIKIKDCIIPAIESLSDTGVIIIDDFDRYESDDYVQLTNNGFSYIPLYGFKQPGYSCTAVFYRDENCLEI